MTVFQELENGTLQFVGDFERLYETDADPWGQSATSGERAPYYRWARDHLMGRLNRMLGERVEGLEIGCGHGHVLAQLWSECGGKWSGMDISIAALQQAAAIHPSMQFIHADISEPVPAFEHAFNIVIWSQMLWYVAEPYEKFLASLDNSMGMLADGGLFVVHQAFLPIGEQRYALKTINGFRGAVEAFSHWPRLQLLEARYREDALGGLHDGLMIFRKLAKVA